MINSLNHIKLYLSILLFALLTNTPLSAQTNEIEFEHIGFKEGLSSNSISSIVQDDDGFLWIGTTYGLNKYDGKKITTFFTDDNDTNSIIDNRINHLFLDSEKRLWIGTNNGICRYDPETENFVRYTTDFNENNSDYKPFIRSISEYNKDTIIYIKDGRIIILDINSKKIKIPVSDVKEDTNSNYFFQLNALDNKVNTTKLSPMFIKRISDNEYLTTSWTYGLLLFNIKENTLKDISQGEFTYSLFASDFSNNILISTWGKGLYAYDAQSKTLKKSNSKLISHNINCTSIDKYNNVWVGADNGITILNENEEPIATLIHDPNNPTSLPNNSVKTIYKDRSGIMWVGTQAGLSKYSSIKKKFRTIQNNTNYLSSISGNNITAIFQSRSNDIWIGTWGHGLNKYINDKNCIIYKNNPSGKNSIPDNYITGIIEYAQDAFIVGTRNKGIFKFNARTGEVKEYANSPIYSKSKWISNLTFDSTHNKVYFRVDNRIKSFSINEEKFDSLPSFSDIYEFDMINPIRFDSKRNIINGTLKGIDVIDPKSYKIITSTSIEIRKKKNLTIKPNTNRVRYIFEDQSGHIWTSSEQIVIRHKPNYSIDKVFNIKWCSAIIDLNNEIWISSKSGLYKYIEEQDTLQLFTVNDGLPSNEIFNMIADNNDMIWLCTNFGISKFSPKNLTFSNYDFYDGLIKNTFDISRVFKANDGQLFFATEDGLNIYNPNELKFNDISPKPAITSLEINNYIVSPLERVNGRVILEKSINHIDEIELTRHEKSFTLTFASLDFTAPEKNSYYYVLYGFDSKPISTFKNSVTYTNLPPGTYTFVLKALNNDGIWSEEEKKLKILIKPALWQTWYFRMIIALIIPLIIFYIATYRTKKIKQHNLLLQKLVNERTYEILEKNEELKTQNDQIAKQREELEQLNSTKDKLFSIISHDLKNPFNAISGFTSLLINNFDNYPNDKKVELLNIIKDSADDAYRLFENLLHWSRANLKKVSFTPRHISLNEIVNENIKFLRLLSKKKNIKLFTDAKEVVAYADKDMVGTIVRNLMANAIKFTKENGEVFVEYIKNENDVIIKVKDNGIGMTHEVIEKLFNTREHYSSKGTQGETGTGIGLILCKDFAERNNGKIWVESTPNEGSIFFVQLPCKNVDKS